MMRCRDAKEMISSYLDNRTDPMNDPLLAEHINSCPECRAELEFLLKYRKVLSEIKPVPAPENFMQELHRRIELEKTGSPLKKILHNMKNALHSFPFPLEAAGVAAIAVMIFFLYKPFFSDKAPVKTTDYAAHAPQGEMSGKTFKREIMNDSLKSSSVKTVPSEKKIQDDVEKIIADKDNSKQVNSADETLSENKKIYDSPSAAQMKKSRTIMKEEAKKAESDKYAESEAMDTKSFAGMKKDSVKPAVTDADRIFRELDVSILLKNMVNDRKIHYKVKVHGNKYNSLIRKLKEKYSVQERILNRQAPFYEIELFLEDK